jgi:hypothetical protein
MGKLKTISARSEASYSVIVTACKGIYVSTHVTKEVPENMPAVSGTSDAE